MKHKHYDLIVAWAAGSKIQYLNETDRNWLEASSSHFWQPERTYRIKPESKPDVILYGMIQQSTKYYAAIDPVCATITQQDTDTCKFIFDGETGKLKAVEVIHV